jgi:hypothetical protein
LNYVSFMASSLIQGLRRAGPADVIIATSPQFLVGISGWIASRLRGVPFVFEVRDLWPDSIAELGVLNEGLAMQALRRLEMGLLSTGGARRRCGAFDTSRIATPRHRSCEDRHHPERRRRASVPGHGKVQRDSRVARARAQIRRFVCRDARHGARLETVLEAADRLRDNPDIAFLFVGEGARKDHLVGMAGSMQLSNVHFVGEQPRERVPSYIATSDVSLVPLRRKPLFTKVLPSKIFEIMGCARPLILGVDGEARTAVETARPGSV